MIADSAVKMHPIIASHAVFGYVYGRVVSFIQKSTHQ